ncbi:MAG: GH36 C-terminal domain-containing protein, partial [Marmoricola sp.]
RPESSDPTVLMHAVVAADRSEALVAHVQLDEPAHNRGVWMRLPGLDPSASYDARWEGPVDHVAVSMSSPLPAAGPTDGTGVTGRALASSGLWFPRRRPETVTLVHLVRR